MVAFAATAVVAASASLSAADYEGGAHVVVARDGRTSVTLRYRHYAPHVTDGAVFETDQTSLTIARGGHELERYDARSLRLIDPTLFPNPGEPSCGAGAPLTIIGHYVVLEGVVAAGGCMSYARVIDLSRLSGGVLASYPVDHPDAHPDVPHPPAFHPARSVHLTSVDRLVIPEDRLHPAGPWPWTLAVVHGVDRSGVAVTLVIERPSAAELPGVGEEIVIGQLEPDPFARNGTVLRLGAAHEAAYARTQPPLSPVILRRRRYNAWFTTAEHDAEAGRFAAAADAFANALDLLDDPQLHAAEARTLTGYRTIISELRAGTITQAEARRRWTRLDTGM
jgi:hypothetical protein